MIYRPPREEHLKDAYKEYRRFRRIRQLSFSIVALIATVFPWYFDFARTETFIWFLGLFVVSNFEAQFWRLKTMQVRLADMDETADQYERQVQTWLAYATALAAAGSRPEDRLNAPLTHGC